VAIKRVIYKPFTTIKKVIRLNFHVENIYNNFLYLYFPVSTERDSIDFTL